MSAHTLVGPCQRHNLSALALMARVLSICVVLSVAGAPAAAASTPESVRSELPSVAAGAAEADAQLERDELVATDAFVGGVRSVPDDRRTAAADAVWARGVGVVSFQSPTTSSPDMVVSLAGGEWVRARLVGRLQPEAAGVHVDGNDALHEDVLSDGADEYFAVGSEMAESWVVLPQLEQRRTLAWDVSYSSGLRAVFAENGDRLYFTLVDGGWIALEVSLAKGAADSIGQSIPMSASFADVGPGKGRLSALLDPSLVRPVGAVAVDPQFSAYPGGGSFQYKICPGTTSGNVCSTGYNDSPNGWPAAGSNSYWNYGSSTGWGPYVGARNVSIGSNYSRRHHYMPAANLAGRTINWSGNLQNPSAKFGCRVEGSTGGTSPTSFAGWRTGTGDFQQILSSGGVNWAWLGIRLQNVSGATFTPGTNNANRCTASGTSGAIAILTIADLDMPTADPPYTDASLNVADTNYDPHAWYPRNAVVRFGFQAADHGSGIKNVTPLLNDVLLSDKTLNICWPDGDNGTPCTTGIVSGKIELQLTGESVETKWLRWVVKDYGDNQNAVSSSDAASIKYDPVPASAPAWVNDGTQADVSYTGGTIAANWALATDEGSGLDRHEYCISTGPSCSGSVVVNWASTALATGVSRSGLPLVDRQVYYVSVRAFDKLGQGSLVTSSNGQVADLSAPANPAKANIYDLSVSEADDKQWTSNDTALSASWGPGSDGTGSGIASYASCFSTQEDTCSGTTIKTGISPTARSAEATANPAMTHGARYYSCVRSTDAVGNVSAWGCSNGFTIDTALVSIGEPVFWNGVWVKGGDALVGYTGADADSGLYSVLPTYRDSANTTRVGATSYVCRSRSGSEVAPAEPATCPSGTKSGSLGVAFSDLNSSQGDNWLTLVANDHAGTTTASAETLYRYDSVAPAAPAAWEPSPSSGATAVGSTDEAVTLSWAAASDATSGVDHYEVYVGTVDPLPTCASCWERTQSSSPTFTTQVGEAATYYWKLRAVDAAGNVGVESEQFSFSVDVTPPVVSLSTPEDRLSKRSAGMETFSGTVDDVSGVGMVKLQWRSHQYQAWNDLGIATIVGGTYSLSCDLPCASPGDAYYEVRAVAYDMASVQNSQATVPRSICRDTNEGGWYYDQPSGVSHEFVGSDAKVWWTAASGSVYGYIVERRSTPDGAWTQIARVPASVTSISDSGLASTEHEWRVSSFGLHCTTANPNGTGTVSALAAGGPSASDVTALARLGTESHWTMHTEQVAGSTVAAANIAGGNVMLQTALTQNAGQGLDSNVTLTYNSQDIMPAASTTAVNGSLGANWLLGLDGLAGAPGVDSFTSIALAPAAITADASTITLRDADGTRHAFTACTVAGQPNASSCPTSYAGKYIAPAGAWLRVRDWQLAGETNPGTMGLPAVTPRYVATRPDRVSFYYAGSDPANLPADDGRLLAIRDRDGNTLTMVYECVAADDVVRDYDPIDCALTPPAGYVKRYRLQKITDQGGRDITLSYFDENGGTSANRDGRLASITDHAGVVTSIAYDRLSGSSADPSPRLSAITEAAATSVERTTSFAYAQGDLANRLEDESMRIVRVTDARGNATAISYRVQDAEKLPRIWHLVDRSDVAAGDGHDTWFDFQREPNTTRATEVFDEHGAKTTYEWTYANGAVTSMTDPNGVISRSTWSDITNRRTANNDGQSYWTYSYDPYTGLPTSAGESAKNTKTAYTNVGLNNFVADIDTVTSARGFVTNYDYDANLRLASVKTPINYGTGAAGDVSTTSYAYYGDGTLKSETNGRGFTTGYSNYDASGIARRVHQRTAGSFDPATTPVDTEIVTDERGQTLCSDDRREASDTGTACEFAATNKVFQQATFDSLRRVVVTTAPWDANRRRAARFSYDANGNQLSETKFLGYTPGVTTPQTPDAATPGSSWHRTYDRADRQISEQLPANDAANSVRKSTTVYDAADRVVKQTEAQGNATQSADDYAVRSSYDAGGRLKGALDGEGRLTCHYYDAYNNEITTTLPMAVAAGTTSCPATAPTTYVTSKTYDSAKRVVSETDVRGKTTTYAFDADGNQTSVTDPKGNTTDTVYSPDGSELEVRQPSVNVCADGTTISQTVCGSTVAHRPTTKTTYDANGNTATQTSARAAESADSALYTTTFTYDAYDRKTLTQLPREAGNSILLYTHTAYDALGRMTASTLQTTNSDFGAVPASEQTVWTYQPDGSIATKTDTPNDVVVSHAYDVSGDQSQRTEHARDLTYTYWPDGSQKTDSSARTASEPWQASFNYQAGQCVTKSTPDGSYFLVTKDGLSDSSEPAWPTVQGGAVEDGATFTRGDCVTTHSYDRGGQILAISLGSAHTLSYDARNRNGDPLTVTGYDGRITRYAYDRNGNETSVQLAGRETRHTYGTTGEQTDQLVRTESLKIGAASTDARADFAYDANGQLTGSTRDMASDLTTSHTRDAGGQITETVSADAAGSGKLYQKQDQRLDAGGSIRYKAENMRIADTQLRGWAASTTYAKGEIVRPSIENGHFYKVTAAGTSSSAEPVWPTAVGGSVVDGATFTEHTQVTTYTYDGQDRVLTDDVAGEVPRRYVYDTMGRIDRIEQIGCTNASWLEDYVYETVNPNQIATLQRRELSAAPSCDVLSTSTDTMTYGDGSPGKPEGSLVTIDNAGAERDTQYRFDALNRQTSAASGAQIKTVAYDPSSRRATESLAGPSSQPGAELKYLYHAQDEDPAGEDDTGTIAYDDQARILDPEDELVAELKDGTTRYTLTNQLGSTVSSITAAGAVKTTLSFDTYGSEGGELSSDTEGSPEKDETAYQYTGQRYDSVGDTTHHQAREYASRHRIWLQTDQYLNPTDDAEITQSLSDLNRTLYAGMNPINQVDPTGHSCERRGITRVRQYLGTGSVRSNAQLVCDSRKKRAIRFWIYMFICQDATDTRNCALYNRPFVSNWYIRSKSSYQYYDKKNGKKWWRAKIYHRWDGDALHTMNGLCGAVRLKSIMQWWTSSDNQWKGPWTRRHPAIPALYEC